ncbi:uncharacterized protein [Spinacia oleracea]|uniref:Uncharacterized protein n=1 Tax=Spinacia oleracea TaxID=3562 RepID=A0ABM3QS27_SPIOL|nr:uncharacterized protein LOC110784410 [Spinacia oleracea]XP_056686165.1 uncharacterized protein LOC110784410 [Spinacia oleracea]XP_056686166.1 uncharacterized protein LOC110784410 [Spinacia oleracea]
MMMQMIVARGGRCAERIVYGDDVTDEGKDDLEKITKFLIQEKYLKGVDIYASIIKSYASYAGNATTNAANSLVGAIRVSTWFRTRNLELFALSNQFCSSLISVLHLQLPLSVVSHYQGSGELHVKPIFSNSNENSQLFTCKAAQNQSSSSSIMSRFQEYLQINTAHPNPKYYEAAYFILSQPESMSLESQTIEFVLSKPLVLLNWPTDSTSFWCSY